MRVLLIIEQCNPLQASVPSLGYHLFRELSKHVDVTLCTHGRNKEALLAAHAKENVIFFEESLFSRYYYKLFSPLTYIKGSNWPLMHALFFPIYAEFNRNVFAAFHNKVQRGEYDIVHVFTPIIPRYPSKIVDACQKTPFILGPVNGGIPFPKGFNDIATKEFYRFNILRTFCRFIPGYLKTYENADKILVGSTYTLEMLRRIFPNQTNKMELFYENGLTEDFFKGGVEKKELNQQLKIIFVGRLVPYKCADLVIQAISQLPEDLKNNVNLTVVGDGPERKNLEDLTKTLLLEDKIIFRGWLPHSMLSELYGKSDLFCFPSIRDFGGAVALEAMASGLPCLTVDYGGLGEYVTENSGFKIAPLSKNHIISELTKYIGLIAKNPELRLEMGKAAFARAQDFA